MAERCALFIIIALGKSIVVTGATFAESELDGGDGRRLLVGARRQRRDVVDLFPQGRRSRLRADIEVEEPGRLARLAYTYLHMPIVAGIIVVGRRR